MARVVHFEIHCGDVDRAERFYTSVFGWDVQRYGGPMDYRLLTTGPDEDAGINGALLKRQGDVGDTSAVIGYVNTVGVGDLSKVEQDVPANGGEIVVPRDEIPGVGQLAYFKDPEGNIFGVLQPDGD